MTTSEPPLDLLCDTTPVRYFAIAGQIGLLITTVGGKISVPREVLDPDEPQDGLPGALSELGRSERYFAKRSADPEATDKWSRLRGLRQRDDIEILDMDGAELEAYAELRGVAFARARGIAPLGPGEAAVIAIAERRDVQVGMDDGPARSVLRDRAPDVRVFTSRDLLKMAVSRGHIESVEALIIYRDMLADFYKGPESLWAP